MQRFPPVALFFFFYISGFVKGHMDTFDSLSTPSLRLLEAQLTFFGLANALSEQQLILFVGERLWKDSGHQRTKGTQAYIDKKKSTKELPFE